MSNELTIRNSIQDITEFANQIASSALIPYHLKGKIPDIILILKMGQELGFDYCSSMNCINVIQGKPSLSGVGMLALIYKHCPDAILDYDDKKAGECIINATRGARKYSAHWDLARAEKMGLLSRDSWKRQPEMMLKWRCVSEVARQLFPDIILGFYNEDEVLDIPEAIETEGRIICPDITEEEKKRIVEKEETREDREKMIEQIEKLFSVLSPKLNNDEKFLLFKELKIKKKDDLKEMTKESLTEVLTILNEKLL